MPQAHMDALVYIVGSFGLLSLILGGVIYSSQKKNKRPASKELVVTKDAELTSTPEVRIEDALKNTRTQFFGRIKNVFSSKPANEAIDEIEEILFTSDIGPATVEKLMESVHTELSRGEMSDIEKLKSALKSRIDEIFTAAGVKEPDPQSNLGPLQYLDLNHKPFVLLIVGVNGAGKTTTIGKLSALLAESGKKVLVAAGDTFRAAAGNQLKVWTDRAQVEIFSPEGVKDPSAVAFDAVSKAKAQAYDVVIVDTAGRLHTQENLMEELKKLKRVMTKVISDAPHETWIVLDANNGQNALHQAREFNQALDLTGVVLTKMDGTAKGGVVIGLADQLKIPIRAIGIGEKIRDLRAFSAKSFISSLFFEE